MSEKQHSLFIFRLRRLIKAFEGSQGLEDLSRPAREVLLTIIEETHNSGPPLVGDITRNADLGSTVTVFAKIKELETQGWISRLPDQEDSRARRIIISAKSQRATRRLTEQVRRLVDEMLASA